MTRPSTPELARRIVDAVMKMLHERDAFLGGDPNVSDEDDKKALRRVVEKELRDR